MRPEHIMNAKACPTLPTIRPQAPAGCTEWVHRGLSMLKTCGVISMNDNPTQYDLKKQPYHFLLSHTSCRHGLNHA